MKRLPPAARGECPTELAAQQRVVGCIEPCSLCNNTKKLLGALLIALAVFLLPGCGHTSNTVSAKKLKKNAANHVATSLDVMQEYEAKLSDIPVPLDSKPLMEQTDIQSADNSMLCYDNEMSPEAIVEFYEREMERCGWQADGAYKGVEVLLNFSKPTRFCSVSIRPLLDIYKKRVSQKGVTIFITTGPMSKMVL
jgi:hypothetical protein